VHLHIGVHWKHRLHYDSLPCHLVYPYEANVMIVWLCLVILDDGRSRVAGTAHDRTLLMMVVLCGYPFNDRKVARIEIGRDN
jgi:hypothetical protein